MLRTLPESAKCKWKDELQRMVHAYNSTPCRSTGFSPFFLLFGREPRLPVDLLFEEVNVGPSRKGWKDYVKEWQTGMKKAYEIASEVSGKVARRNKEQYDKKAGAAMLEEGDRVLVRNLREKGGPGKLRAQWEGKAYRVKERRGDGPVYVVQSEKGGEERVLHRNHLLPIGMNVRMEEPEVSKEKDSKKGKVNKAGKGEDRNTKEKVGKDQKKVKVSEDEAKEEISSSEASTTDEEEISRNEARKGRPRRRRKKPDVLMYRRMGSPGQINRVYTPHPLTKNSTTVHLHKQNEQNTTFQRSQNNDAQRHQINNFSNKNTLLQQRNNSQSTNTAQTQTHNTHCNNLYNAEGSHQQHQCAMEHWFLVQMLEQQQVLTSMMLSVMLVGKS